MDTEASQRLLGTLVAQNANLAEDVREIKESIAAHASRIEQRISALEMKNARLGGGYQALAIVAGAAATIGGIVAHLVGKVWPT